VEIMWFQTALKIVELGNQINGLPGCLQDLFSAEYGSSSPGRIFAVFAIGSRT